MKYPIANVTHHIDPSKRIVGFVLKDGDQPMGQMGLSEPCFWLESLVKKAERYEWLRERMTLEHIPDEHPKWSTPSEYESQKIDEAIDSRMNK